MISRQIFTLSLFAMTLGTSAQTQVAKDLYAKATSPNANIEKIIKSASSKADSTSCHDLAVMFYQANDFAYAAACLDVARQKVVKFGKNYEKILNLMVSCYVEMDDQQGMALVMALMEEHNQHELTLPCDEPECMVDRAEYYAATGDNAQAKEHYLKALQMPMTEAQKTNVYESYAKFNGNVHEYALAAEYFLMAANAKKTVEDETEDYIQLLYKTAVYNFLGKQYEQSLGYYRQVIAFYEKRSTDAARKNIAQCHKGMGNALSALQRYAEACEEHKLVVEYYEQCDTANEDYPGAIERVATAEKFNKEYDASIDHYKQAIAIYMERGMSEKARDAQNSLNLCYAYAGRPMESNEEVERAAKETQMAKLDAMIQEETENLEIYRTYLGKMQYADALATIAGCYQAKEDYGKSIEYYQQYIVAMRDAIREEFRMQSEAERMTTWEEEKFNLNGIIDMLATLPAGYERYQSDISALAYDCMLLSKGILLNSSIEFEKVINDRATTELMTQFYKGLMAGCTPNQSLRKAQQYLRQHGYDDPQYWASFIILDGK